MLLQQRGVQSVHLSVSPSSVVPTTPPSWNFEMTSALGGRMISRSQDVTCLVPQARTSFGLEGETGTVVLPSAWCSADAPARNAVCQALVPTAGGERGAPSRVENELEMRRSLDEGSAGGDFGEITLLDDGDWPDRRSHDELMPSAASWATARVFDLGSSLLAAFGGRSQNPEKGSFLSEGTSGGGAAAFASPAGCFVSLSFFPLHLGPWEGTRRNGMLSWQRMHVTIRLGSPCPSLGPTTEAIPTPSFSLSLSAVLLLLSCSLSLVGGSMVVLPVEVDVEGRPWSGESVLPSYSAFSCCCLMGQDFLCFSRLRTNTLTPHW